MLDMSQPARPMRSVRLPLREMCQGWGGMLRQKTVEVGQRRGNSRKPAGLFV